MAKYLFANNAKSTLAAGVSASATVIPLNAGDGAKFPAPAAGEQFTVTLEDSSKNIEVCVCTGRAGDNLTVVRGGEGTAARAWNAGDSIGLRVTDAALQNLAQKDQSLQTGLNSEMWAGSKKTVSTAAPSGGSDGDIHFRI